VKGPRATATLTAVAALALIAAAPAGAAKGKKKKAAAPVVRSATATTTQTGQLLSVPAACPNGTRATGGGFNVPPDGTPTDDLQIVYESRRFGPTGWISSAVRVDGDGTNDAVPLTTYVHCRSPKLKNKPGVKKGKRKRLNLLEAASASAPTAQGIPVTASATCPGKHRAVGGGFSSSPVPDVAGPGGFPVHWQTMRTGAKTWSSSMTNSGSALRTITSFVYCADGVSASQVSGSAPIAGSMGPTIGSATAIAPACPGKRRLLGGGFNNSPAGLSAPVAQPTQSAAVTGQWRSGALNLSATPGTLSALGYCL
jgi:hypothetical protein